MSKIIEQAAAIFRAGDAPTSLDQVPCTCTHLPGLHSGAKQRGVCREEGCECGRFRPNQAMYFAARANLAAQSTLNRDLREYDRQTRTTKVKGPDEISVRVSDIGECRKAVEFRNRPPEGFEPDPEDKRPAFIGTLIHDATLQRRRKLYPWRMFGDLKGMEVYLPGLDRPGHYDEFDPITGRLVDLKTAGMWRWGLTGDEGADEKWWKQLSLYGLALTLMGYTVTELCVLVIERAGGKDEVFSRPFDIDFAYAALNELTTLSTAIELGIPQPRDRSGPTTDGICRNCFARSACWDIPKAEAAGRSPESWVKLGQSPDELAIAAVVEELVEVRKVKTTAEKQEDEVKALLVGIEPGTYGDFEGWLDGRSDDDYKGAHAALVELVKDIPEQYRPAIPPVPKSRRSWMTWRKMRVATRKRLEQERKAAEAAQTVDLSEAV